MNAKKTKRLVFLAVNAALVCVATMVIRIPSTMGYKNFGDVFVIFAAMFFDPITAAISGGIGAALADIFGGYASYAAFTLVIKALEGFVAGLVFRLLSRVRFNYYAAVVVSALPAALVMAAGYFATNYLFLNGELAAAVADFTGDLFQGAIGVVGGVALIFALSKTPNIETVCGSSALVVYKRYAARGGNHKKAVLISDLSGLGRCSLAAQTTIIGASGHEAVCLPTAVLSAQTGFKDYAVLPLPQTLDIFPQSWDKMNFSPDVMLTGYIADAEQVRKIGQIAAHYKQKGVKIAVDPIMGDGGTLYPALGQDMVAAFKELVSQADVITPNLTEACLLSGFDYNKTIEETDKKTFFAEISEIADALSSDGKQVIITGILFGKRIYNFVKCRDNRKIIGSVRRGSSYSGTGDILSSVVAGGIMSGEKIVKSVKKATRLINKAIADAEIENTDPKEGINYQRYLYML